jgi:hypothetical protein
MAHADDRYLGLHQKLPVTLHAIGKFGPYVCWNSKNKSVKSLLSSLKKDLKDLELADIVSLFEAGGASANANILRQITAEASIRKGPHGDYIYWQKAAGKTKPKFLKFPSTMPTDYLTCDAGLLETWFKTYYDVQY